MASFCIFRLTVPAEVETALFFFRSRSGLDAPILAFAPGVRGASVGMVGGELLFGDGLCGSRTWCGLSEGGIARRVGGGRCCRSGRWWRGRGLPVPRGLGLAQPLFWGEGFARLIRDFSGSRVKTKWCDLI